MKQMFLIACLSIFSGSLLAFETPGERVWDIIADTETKIIFVESKLCELIPLITPSLSPTGISPEFAGTFTAIETALEKACTIASKLDVVESILDNVDFFGTFTALDAVQKKVCTIESKVDALPIDDLIGCFGTAIRQLDVGTTGFTIDSPGKYYLAEHIRFDPTIAGNSAITISASNVVLDLRGRTIRQANNTATTVGIEVSATNNNVQIINGAIVETTGQGISVGTSCICIALINITVKDTKNDDGIEIGSSSEQITFDNVAVYNCDGHGILANSTTGIEAIQCVFEGNGQSGTGDGLRFSNCDETSIINCLSNNNNNNGYTIISTTTSTQHLIKMSHAMVNSNHGILIEHVDDALVTGCFSVENIVDGIHLTDARRVKLIKNCLDSNDNDNIRLATASTGTNNCYIAENSMVLATSVNLRELSGSGPNSIFGNFALATTTAGNYVTSGSTTINLAVVDQAGMLPIPAPGAQINISMTT